MVPSPVRSQLAVNLVDIASKNRGEVGVDHGGITAGDQLHEGAHLVADRHLGEPEVPGDDGYVLLVFGVAIAVHERDRDRVEATLASRRRAPTTASVSMGTSVAGCRDAFIHSTTSA